jgi:hypothetical protein
MRTPEFLLLNVFLRPAEFAQLPLEVVPLFDDLEQRAREEPDPRKPLQTAICRVPLASPFETEDKAGRAVYWLVRLVGFLTRRPTGADLQITRDESGEEIAWRPLLSVAPQVRDGNRMFRTPDDLRAVFDAGWDRWDEDSEGDRRLHRAFDWHDIARGGMEYAPADLSLLHHWIAVESLAGEWAESRSLGGLLDQAQVADLRSTIEKRAIEWQLSPRATKESVAKLRELERRPSSAVLIEYITDVLGPYKDVQPLGKELKSLVRTTIEWRNRVVHGGELRVDDIGGGLQTVWHRMRQLDCLTEKVLLAAIGAQIAYLTEVPWTYIMVAA